MIVVVVVVVVLVVCLLLLLPGLDHVPSVRQFVLTYRLCSVLVLDLYIHGGCGDAHYHPCFFGILSSFVALMLVAVLFCLWHGILSQEPNSTESRPSDLHGCGTEFYSKNPTQPGAAHAT